MNRTTSRILQLATLATVMLCFAGVASAGSILLSVSGDGGTDKAGNLGHTLFTVDMSDASTQHYLTLDRDGDGESIAWNPDDGLLYRGSGNDGTKTFWSIDLTSRTVTQIPITGPTATNDEFVALTHDPATGNLYSTQRGPNSLRTITTGGAETHIGSIGATSHGLAMVGGSLLSANNNNLTILELNPADGSTTNSFAMSTDIPGATGFTALARNPDDGTLWGVVRVGGTVERHLVQIKSLDILAGTGTMTDIGDMGNRFAGLAFVPEDVIIPEPSTAILGALALLGLAVSGLRSRRR